MQGTPSVLAFALMVGGLAGEFYFAGGLLVPSRIVTGTQLLAVLLMLWARMTFGQRSFNASANAIRSIPR